MNNIRSGTTFFLIYINGQRGATQILQDLQDLHLFYRKSLSIEEMQILHKKKIQMFVVNMTFISSREVKKCIFHSCFRHSWNVHFFTSLDEIKVIFTPNIWISSIYYITVYKVKQVFCTNWLVPGWNWLVPEWNWLGPDWELTGSGLELTSSWLEFD